jgi:hypothetical protein
VYVYTDFVRTPQTTQGALISKADRLMLCSDVIVVRFVQNVQYVMWTKCTIFSVKPGGRYTDH